RLQDGGDALAVVELAGDRQAFFEMLQGSTVLAHAKRELPCIRKRPAARNVAGLRIGTRQRLQQSVVADLELPAHKIVASRRADQAQTERTASRCMVAPRVRRENVLAFVVELREPRTGVGADEARRAFLAERDVILEMAIANRGRLARGVE